MGWPLAIAAGATVIGGILQSQAAGRAGRTARRGAEAQAEAQRYAADLNLQAQQEAIAAEKEGRREALGLQRELTQQAREDVAPWRQAGANALTQLQERIQAGPGEFRPTEDPGYKFGYEEFIQKPAESQASALGTLRSGALQKDLTRYAQDYASTKYDNFLNRFYQSLTPLQSMAGLGQTSAGQMAGISAGSTAPQLAAGGGQAQANLLTRYQHQAPDVSSAYAAQAAGQMAQGNIYGNMVGNIGQNIGQYMQYRQGLQGGGMSTGQTKPPVMLNQGATTYV